MAFFGRAALAAGAAVAIAAPAFASTLSTAFYSPALKAVVIPYRGALPSYYLGTAKNPPRVFMDFKAAYVVGTRTGRAPGHPSLLEWAMSPRNATTTRVALTFRSPTQVRVIHDPRRHWIMLVPQPNGAKPAPRAAAPKAGHYALGRARWDAGRRAVVVPYRGAFPDYTTGTANNPPRVYVDLEAPGMPDPQKAAVSGHPTLTGYEMAARSASTMRVVLNFRSPTEVSVQNDTVRHEVLIIPKNTAPTPAPLPEATPTPLEPPPIYQDPTLAPPRPGQ